MRRFGLHSNSRGTDEVKGLLISIDFCNRITELLFLFSIISPWHYNVFPVDKGRKLNVHKRFRRRPGRLLNVLCTFNLRPVCTGLFEFRANLSNDYFTNRQDRYIVFEDCPELSNYYDELVKTVSSFSFQLNEDNNVTLSPAFNIHPYKNSKKDFNQAAGNLIEKFTKQYANISFQKQTISITDSEDTLVFPLLQMKTFGIDQDQHVTSNILRSNQSNCCICLATAYFNCTDDYWKALLQGRGQVSVVMAHPKAMGFYKAPGLAGGIPKAYSLIALRRYRDLLQKEKNNIEFREFMKNGWTFHGKGLWLEIKRSRDNSGKNLFMTLIGSPNFGKRSVYRDIESQIGIITYNEKLKKEILAEKEDMLSYCSDVTMATFDQDERTPSWWVYLIATLMNDQF